VVGESTNERGLAHAYGSSLNRVPTELESGRSVSASQWLSPITSAVAANQLLQVFFITESAPKGPLAQISQRRWS